MLSFVHRWLTDQLSQPGLARCAGRSASTAWTVTRPESGTRLRTPRLRRLSGGGVAGARLTGDERLVLHRALGGFRLVVVRLRQGPATRWRPGPPAGDLRRGHDRAGPCSDWPGSYRQPRRVPPDPSRLCAAVCPEPAAQTSASANVTPRSTTSMRTTSGTLGTGYWSLGPRPTGTADCRLPYRGLITYRECPRPGEVLNPT
jgi:hypothetical protein